MSATLVLLPGLGADGRLFGPQRAAIPDLITLSWPEARPHDTLTSYAARVASTLPAGAPLVLGGSSFGGMVALEMASLLRPEKVVLIGSCASPRSLAPWIRLLRTPARIAPSLVVRPQRWVLPIVVPEFRRLNDEQRDLTWSMAEGIPASFLKWGLGAILGWRPTPVPVPVHHIHGSRDALIPVGRTRPSRVVDGGGHLLTLTHPEAVNAFLLEVLRDTRP